jgi:hypothetical protein
LNELVKQSSLYDEKAPEKNWGFFWKIRHGGVHLVPGKSLGVQGLGRQ